MEQCLNASIHFLLKLISWALIYVLPKEFLLSHFYWFHKRDSPKRDENSDYSRKEHDSASEIESFKWQFQMITRKKFLEELAGRAFL